jgi:hypothetical protein
MSGFTVNSLSSLLMRAPDHVTPMAAVRFSIMPVLKCRPIERVSAYVQLNKSCYTYSSSVTRGIFTYCTISGFASLETNRNTNL